MAYIGKTPATGAFQKCDALSASGTADYTLQVGSVNVVPESVNHMIVSLNGVIQAPTTAYTVAGSTLSFASSLTSSDTIDFVMLLGNVLDIGTPSDATVSTAKIVDANVTTAKLATTLLTGATDIGGAIADADLFLLDDGAGGTLRRSAMSRIKTYVTGGITQADHWRLTSDLLDTATPIASNLERVDTDSPGFIGSAMSESSGIFTFPSTGIYLLTFGISQQIIGTADYASGSIQTTTDNSSYSDAALSYVSAANTGTAFNSAFTTFIFDVTNTTTHKARFSVTQADSANKVKGNTGITYTGITFIRLGDT